MSGQEKKTGAPMPTFEAGDIVAVPFPYVERPILERRPALVIADGLGAEERLAWVLMITSASNPPWPDDIAITVSSQGTGLRAASVIRTAKMATIESETARKVGHVGDVLLGQIRSKLAERLGLIPQSRS